jgi:hypothetical protein
MILELGGVLALELNERNICRIWDSHSGDYEQFYLLGYNAAKSVESQLILRSYMLPSTSFVRYLLNSGFYIGLFFDPEAGGDIFLRNIGRFSTD